MISNERKVYLKESQNLDKKYDHLLKNRSDSSQRLQKINFVCAYICMSIEVFQFFSNCNRIIF